MEPLTSAGAGKRGWIGYLLVVAAVASGPENLARLVSLTTSIVTWPITQEIRIEANRFEIFNTELLFVYIVAAIGLGLLTQSGMISLGHSAFIAAGAYTVALATIEWSWSFWPALALAALVCAALGLVLGLPALRLGAFTLAMVTVGYAFVVEDLLVEWRSVTGGGDGLRPIRMPAPFDDLESYYWLVAIAAILAYVIGHNLIRSPLGRASRAIEENPVAAQSLGIDPYRVKLTGFVASATLAGVAGGLYAPLLGFVAPDSFTVNLSVLLLLMVLFGGSGSVAGPVVGALLLFRIPIEVERVTDSPGEWSLLAYGVVLVISVLVVPRGLMSGWRLLVGRLRRQPTDRAQRRRPDIASVTPPVPDRVGAAAGVPLLELANLAKTINGVRALVDVSMAVQPGQVHALIGPNGSGKTTTLNAVSGYLALDHGHVALDGTDLATLRPHRRAAAGIARTFQTPFVFETMTCADNVTAALDLRHARRLSSYLVRLPRARRSEARTKRRALELLDALGLGPLADVTAGSLPPGERRLLELARVLALEPRLVLMDEPAAGLSDTEVDELAEVIAALRTTGIAVVLVEHHVEFVLGLADTVTVLDFGRVIAAGPPDAIRSDPVVISAYLGGPLPGVELELDVTGGAG